jgi:hypothetical protein
MPRVGALLSFVFALTVAIQLGCGGPTLIVEHYSGPRRAPETIAILRFYGNDRVLLVTIDGQRADATLAEDVRLHVEVLPGKHRLGVVSNDDPQGPLRRVSFEATATKVYRVIFADDGQARVYEIDSETDAPQKDVTLVERDDEPQSRIPPSMRGRMLDREPPDASVTEPAAAEAGASETFPETAPDGG